MSLPANFPASLDALANPTATTNRDDPGFQLDLVIARIQDILEALEAKVGIGASVPSAAGVLRRTAGSSTAWGQVATGDIVLNAATKLWYIATPTVSLTGPGPTLITTVTTSDWAGTGQGLAIWTPWFGHATAGVIGTIYWSLDGGAQNPMGSTQNPNIGSQTAVPGAIPLIGISGVTHDHKFWFGNNGAGGAGWTVSGGYAIVVELRK